MTLTKYKLGDLIEQVDVRNTDLRYGIDDVRGISNMKVFQHTKADVASRDFSKFKIIEPGVFVYNRRTTRMGEKIAITLNSSKETYIVTDDYVSFRVVKSNLLDSQYLYLWVNRAEFDRLARFHSWGSATELISWDSVCDIEIDLPPIEIQRKYVGIYRGLKANLEAYHYMSSKNSAQISSALLCTSYSLGNYTTFKLGDLIERHDVRNKDNSIKNVKGISVTKSFREPTSKVNRNSLHNYKIVHPRQFAFVQTTHNEKVFAFAFNDMHFSVVVSSVNEVFSVNEKHLLAEYLDLFLRRPELDRYARYHSWGSARETFTWSDLCDIEIKLPPIEIQQKYVDIAKGLNKKKEIHKRLTELMQEICPVLIHGSLLEALSDEEV